MAQKIRFPALKPLKFEIVSVSLSVSESAVHLARCGRASYPDALGMSDT
jgi:hypothetical protein